MSWPGKTTYWIDGRTLYASIPFTWELSNVRATAEQRSIFFDDIVVGGPAITLMPKCFDDMPWVKTASSYPGVLQKVNPWATRTTVGCINRCGFCAVPKIEPAFRELKDWPDLPVICDNNLLASSVEHFDRVIERLKHHQGVDFNQGIDSRLLTKYHAERIAEIRGIKKRGVRLALDNMGYAEQWGAAFEKLRSAGIAKRKISSYALIGYDSDPSEAWARCQWIEEHKIRALPMWFHRLDQMVKNIVTRNQKQLGWDDYERRKIMQWFYQHKMVVKQRPVHYISERQPDREIPLQ